MKRKLRTFAQCANQNQGQQDWIEAVSTDLVACGEYGIQIVAADDMAEQHNPRQQTQSSSTRNHQRHVGTASGVGAVVPITNQQK